MANIWYIENGVIHCYKKDGLATVVWRTERRSLSSLQA